MRAGLNVRGVYRKRFRRAASASMCVCVVIVTELKISFNLRGSSSTLKLKKIKSTVKLVNSAQHKRFDKRISLTLSEVSEVHVCMMPERFYKFSHTGRTKSERKIYGGSGLI